MEEGRREPLNTVGSSKIGRVKRREGRESRGRGERREGKRECENAGMKRETG